MYINLFWAIFAAVLILASAVYAGGQKKLKYGLTFKNGVFGGFWLMVPIYAYLVTNT